MAEALAGNFVRAEDILDTLVASVTTDTSIATAAAGFTLTLQEASTYGRLAMVRINVTSTTAINQSPGGSGNLPDTTICTLDAAYRPLRQVSFAFYGGIGGAGYIQTGGAVRLANADRDIPSGTGLELGVTLITA
jgi:hypothetical protein